MFKKVNQQILYAVAFWSTTPRLIILAVLFFILNGIVLPSFEADLMAYSNGTGVMDLLPMYTPEEALRRLTAYTEPGRRVYLMAEWSGDLIYPPVYSFLFAGVLYRLGAKNWSTLPVFIFLADYLENIFITIMLTSYPDFSRGIARVASACTSLKWLLLVINLLLILGFAGWAIYKRIQNRRNAV